MKGKGNKMKMKKSYPKMALASGAVTALLLALSASAVQAAGVLQPVDPSVRKLQGNELATRKEMVIEDENKGSASIVSGKNRFLVKEIHLSIKGDVQEADLRPLVAPYEGRELNFEELQQVAYKVSTWLRKNKNYYLATAFYPEQDIKDGHVTMNVVIGHYGSIHIYNDTNLSSHRAVSYSEPLVKGAPLFTGKLEGVMENYNNLPGIEAKAVLKPGTLPGESDMDIYLDTLDTTEVSLFTDNYGGEYSGRYRYGVNVQFNNPGHNGDSLNVGGMLSSGGGVKDYWAGYEVPAGHFGSRMGISFSHMGYELGDWYSRLGAKGKADTLSIYGMTPLIQKSDTFVKLLYGASWRWFNDRYDAWGYKSDKETRGFYLGIGGAYESRKTYTNYTAMYTRGSTKNTHLRYNWENHDEERMNPGSFHKFNIDCVHEDYIDSNWTLHFAFHGQLASHALDGSEKMSLGGPYGVRAYPSSEGAVDTGYQATAEIRYKLADGLTIGPFFDIGEGQMDKSVDDHRKLMGWGVGIQFMNKKEYYHRQPAWYVRLDWARKIDGEPNLSSRKNKDSQFWFRLVRLL